MLAIKPLYSPGDISCSLEVDSALFCPIGERITSYNPNRKGPRTQMIVF